MTRMQSVEVHRPSWAWRAVVTASVLVLCWSLLTAYNAVQGPMEAHTAVAQLQDNNETYAVSRTWAAANLQSLVRGAGALAIGLLWGTYVRGLLRYAAATQRDE